MKVFTMGKTVTGEGEEKKTEFQITGNIGMIEAQQMLTEIIVATSRTEGAKQAKQKEDPKK